MLQRFVRNQGDAWSFVLEDLKRNLTMPPLEAPQIPNEQTTPQPTGQSFLPQVLGERTAELHLALSRATENATFAPEPMTAETMETEVASLRASADRAFDALRRLGDKAGPGARALLERTEDCMDAIDRYAANWHGLPRIRIHGDFHLGQVLLTEGDVIFVDFEGEPARSSDERRAKLSPLQDVAGMLRSFAYAAEVAARDVTSRLAVDHSQITERAREWGRHASTQFLESYRTRIRSGSDTPLAELDWTDHLRFQLLKKAFYEVEYEANNRPDWVGIPTDGILEILSRGDSE